MAGGRPTKFTKEIADKVCEEIATSSKSLKTICQSDEMPSPRTILSWLADGEKEGAKPEFKEFLHKYTRAREQQADVLADEIIEIADDGTNDLTTIKGELVENREVTNRSKLRVEARKWVAAKLKPKKYGDRINLDHEGEQTIIVKFQDE